jgi:NAD(P)-dependent dehydrogenase (short-subunit alcohol dehydrogenase family)
MADSRMNNRISPFSDLAGRVVIVTGAAAGIGLSISNAFAKQGCQLALLDVNETSLTETAKRLEKSGTHVITVTGSVPELETARHTCAEAVRQYGHIDVLSRWAMSRADLASVVLQSTKTFLRSLSRWAMSRADLPSSAIRFATSANQSAA